MDWRHRAICRDEDPELFFPVGNSGPALLQIAEAKAVCARCPVSNECLNWALETGQDAGVWGGLSRGRAPLAQAAPRPRPGTGHARLRQGTLRSSASEPEPVRARVSRSPTTFA